MYKHLEKKVDLYLTESSIETQNPMELEYFLIESDSVATCRDLCVNTHINKDSVLNMQVEEGCSPSYGVRTYGIEIIKKERFIIECEQIVNFSLSRDKTVEAINKLARNSVTPVSLFNIIDDIIGM